MLEVTGELEDAILKGSVCLQMPDNPYIETAVVDCVFCLAVGKLLVFENDSCLLSYACCRQTSHRTAAAALMCAVPGLPPVGLRHPLQSAHSPLIRALPDYEAQFTQQLGEARAYWEASQQRLHRWVEAMFPLIRALPDCEAHFTQQLGEARAYWEASQQRLHR